MKLSFEHKQTWLHRVNPAFKLLSVMALLIWILFVHNLDVMINLTIISLLMLALFSGHPPLRLLVYASPFLLIFLSGFTTMAFFGKGSTIWAHWGLIRISEESFYRGLNLGLRALSFSSFGLLFALTTRPVLLFYSLMQQLRLPPKYAYSFMASIRLVPMMLEELQTIRHALRVRGTERRRGPMGAWTKLKRYSVPMLAQSIRRAQRIAVAMEAKRFSSAGKRTYYYEVGLSKYDALLAVSFLIMAIAAFWLGRHCPYLGVEDVRKYGS